MLLFKIHPCPWFLPEQLLSGQILSLQIKEVDEKRVTLTYKLNGWYFGNILFGGAIGMQIIDPATSAMWKIKDPTITSVVNNKMPIYWLHRINFNKAMLLH